MYFKTYEIKSGLMVAVADRELIGKKLKFKGREFFVNPRFYQGELANKEKVIALLKNAVSINLVGEKSVACGKESGMISDENILQITKKVPHAQSIVIPEH